MKRIIPFLLILVLLLVQLPSLLAVSASAAEDTSSDVPSPIVSIYNSGRIVTYAPNYSRSGLWSFTFGSDYGDGLFSVHFPSRTYVRYIDFLIWCSDPLYFEIEFNDLDGELNLSPLQGDIYRVYGPVYSSEPITDILFQVYGYLGSSFEILDFKYSSDSSIYQSLTGRSELRSGSTVLGSQSDIRYSEPITVDESVTGDFQFYVYTGGTVFDFLQITCMISTPTVESFNVLDIGAQAAPVSVSWYEPGGYVESAFNIVTFTIDLRNVDRRLLEDEICLYVSGLLSHSTDLFDCMEIVGSFYFPGIDSTSYWFSVLERQVADLGYTIGMSHYDIISLLQSLIGSGSGEAEDIKNDIKDTTDNFKSDLGSLNSSIEKPPVSDIQSPVDSLEAVGFTGNTAHLTMIANTSYIKEMLIFSSLLLLVGLAFFGKKG